MHLSVTRYTVEASELEKDLFPEEPRWVALLHLGSDQPPRQAQPLDILSENRGEAEWRTLTCCLFCFPYLGYQFLAARTRRDSEPSQAN